MCQVRYNINVISINQPSYYYGCIYWEWLNLIQMWFDFSFESFKSLHNKEFFFTTHRTVHDIRLHYIRHSINTTLAQKKFYTETPVRWHMLSNEHWTRTMNFRYNKANLSLYRIKPDRSFHFNEVTIKDW